MSSESLEEEYVTKEHIINELQQIITNINNGIIDGILLQDLHDDIKEYIQVHNNTNQINKEFVEYFFKGWWLTQAMITGEKPSDICPFCLKTLPSN